jgi:plasmid stabilization system protein ParE
MQDLERLAVYIAEESERNAFLVESRIHESAKRLSLIQGGGRPGRVTGTRELVVLRTPYILVYRLTAGTVCILRVYHCARRWPSRFD